MNVYYNVALLVFRVGAVAWFIYALNAIIATYISLFTMAATIGPRSTNPFTGLLAALTISLLAPFIIFFAAPLLAKACTWGAREE